MLCSRIQIRNAVAVLKQTKTLNEQVNCCKQSISSCFEGYVAVCPDGNPDGCRQRLSGRMFYLFAGLRIVDTLLLEERVESDS